MRSASSAVRSCRVGVLLVLAVALLAGPSPAGERGIGPAVAPTIALTTPAADAFGVNGSLPIEVRFSEAMNASSLQFAFQPNATVNVTASWPTADHLLLTPEAPGLANCTIFELQIAVRDVNENLSLLPGAVPNPWRFMVACDRPYVVATSPADGARNVRPTEDVVVTFSEPMDCTGGTLTVTFFPSLPPPVTLQTRCEQNNTVFRLQLLGTTAFESGVTYSATANGRDNATRTEWLVPSTVPNPWTFTVNAAPVVSKPTLSAAGCLDAGSTVTVAWSMSDEDGAANLTVRLLYWDGLTFVPFVGPQAGFGSPASYAWTLPPENLTTRVRIEVNDSLGALSTNESAPFQIDGGPPDVFSTTPPNGATDVPVNATFTVVFTEPMNTTWTEAAIQEAPSFPSRILAWNPANTSVTIRPGLLQDWTNYTVTIRGTARDACGVGRPMGVDRAFAFTTARPRPMAPTSLSVTAFGDTSISLAWPPVTAYVSGRPLSPTDIVTYRLLRSTAGGPWEPVTETTATTFRDTGLSPDTNYTYEVIAGVSGIWSAPTSVAQKTRLPFLSTPEGRASVLVSLVAVGVALTAGAYMFRERKRTEAETAAAAELEAEIQEVVDEVRKVRAEPDPVRRRERAERLQAHFASLVAGPTADDDETDRPNPRLEGLYRALAQAIVHSPEIDLRRGRGLVDGRLGNLASRLRDHGAAYRLLSEAEASVQSDLFPTLPESARKALLLVYFYGLEEYLSSRLMGLVPAGATVLLGERGHINVRRKDWQRQWAGLTLGNLLYVLDHNTHLFIADLEKWETNVAPILKEAVVARNKTAHPSREGPPLDRVRELVYRAIPAVESILKWPRGPTAV